MVDLTEQEQTKLLKLLARVERKALLRMVERRTSFSFPQWFYELLDRNRQPMGMTRKAFIMYCIKQVTKPYEKERAQKWQRIKSMGYDVPKDYEEVLEPEEVLEALEGG